MKIVVELVVSKEDQKLLHELRRELKMFIDSIGLLTTAVNALVAQNGNESAAIAAAVAAKDAQDAAQVDAVTAIVNAALLPPPAPAAPKA